MFKEERDELLFDSRMTGDICIEMPNLGSTIKGTVPVIWCWNAFLDALRPFKTAQEYRNEREQQTIGG